MQNNIYTNFPMQTPTTIHISSGISFPYVIHSIVLPSTADVSLIDFNAAV